MPATSTAASLELRRARHRPGAAARFPRVSPLDDEAVLAIVRDIASQQERLRALEQLVAGFEATGHEIWQTSRDVTELRREIEREVSELSRALRDTRKGCEDLGTGLERLAKRLDDRIEARLGRRASIGIALITTGGTLLTVIVTRL